MKVLQIGKYYYPEVGGIENAMYDLTEALNREGVETDVLCSARGLKTVHDEGFTYRVTRCGSLGVVAATSISPVMILRLRRIIAEYDIVHLHHPDPMANVAVCLSARKDTKLVVHWHSDIVKQKYLVKLYRPILHLMLRRADAIIATSEQYVDGSRDLQKYLDKITVLPIGVNPGKFTSTDRELMDDLRSRYGGKKVVFTLGRQVYYKGFEYLVQAAAELPEGFVTLIGGHGPLFPKLAQMIKDRGLGDRVFLIGHVHPNQLSTYFSFCDIFVLPSIYRSEAYGIVQAEAMYFGKPVVSTDIPDSGVCWVNRKGTTGLVVPPRDPKALAHAISEIIGDEKVLQKMSNNSRRVFREEYHIDRVVHRYVDFYTALMNG